MNATAENMNKAFSRFELIGRKGAKVFMRETFTDYAKAQAALDALRADYPSYWFDLRCYS